MSLTIDPAAAESRYDRQERITWWDQDALKRAKVLVIGAGALGNEIVKNLALLGIGEVHIVDMDSIERSNLARCAMFRDEDEGGNKAEVLARAAASLNPDCRTVAYVVPIQSLGAAAIAGFDVIIAGLDNMEARLWINRAARRLGKYWIDGAIEGLQGIVRAFPPSGACLECTLGEQDFKALSHRRSCALLSPEELVSGKTPTNSTSASIVAGIEVQEAVKFLVGRHDLLSLNNRVWRLEGESMTTSTVGFFEDEYCMAHDSYEEVAKVVSLHTSWPQLFEAATQHLGENPEAIDFEDDLVLLSGCPTCSTGGLTVGLRALFPKGAGRCSGCGEDLPAESAATMELGSIAELPELAEWLWPHLEFMTFRAGSRRVHIPIGQGSLV